ncbi:hypothetical protein ABKN59_004427 [Abortiporus biennis]
MAPVGEPKESPKPQPIGNGPFIVLFTICALCAIFLLWRRASALRSVVGHQLKRITGQEGTIRLSLDDGPSSHEFLSDDFDEDNEHLDNEPLARAWKPWTHLQYLLPLQSRSEFPFAYLVIHCSRTYVF